MAPAATDHDAAKALWHRIKDMRMAMMTTRHTDGSLRSRPMATLTHAGFDDAVLWFFTRAGSEKTDEIAEDAAVNLAYADPDHQIYVSVSGAARLVRDRGRIAELWREPLATWFPQGKDDPDIALIQVAVTGAEYWDAPSAAMVHAYGYLKAKLTGEPPKAGEHDSLRIR